MHRSDRKRQYFINHSNHATVDSSRYTNPTTIPDLILRGDVESFVPRVFARASDHFFRISGECYLNLTNEFFGQIFQWFDSYLNTQPNKVRVEFALTYYNTSTSRKILELLRGLDKYQKENKSSRIDAYWYYQKNDEYIKVDGEMYQSELDNLHLQVVEYNQQRHNRMLRVVNALRAN